ncbi:uncharacterized protein LOC108047345 [Drosophila rhopaloa]|uniref:Uncharacterized protein LOC108047346 n=1 Tax=Drosophila rhopaloa TaxID=1041015 RepID=A0A6P4F6M2_DRORH|nr:uncharacterized protein LOC108047345 [Drosophila rhopaloa]
MIATTVCFYLVLLAILMVFLSPSAEGCFILLACLLESPLCPFNTTALG